MRKVSLEMNLGKKFQARFPRKAQNNLKLKIVILEAKKLYFFFFFLIFISDEQLLSKLITLRSKFWGVDFFLEFLGIISRQSKNFNLNSIEFQNYLNTVFKLFRIRKSKIFPKISELCYEIYFNQFNSKLEPIKIKAVSDAMAANLIELINQNVVGENLIYEAKLLEDFEAIFSDKAQLYYPLNIIENIKENNILKLHNECLRYENVSIYNYNYLFSTNLMDIVSTKDTDIFYKIKIENLELMLDNLININLLDFVSPELKEKEEYPIFLSLIKDFTDPEQFYTFDNFEVNKYYQMINKHKLFENDKMFHSLLVYFLDGVFFSFEKPKNNSVYRQILKDKNEK